MLLDDLESFFALPSEQAEFMRQYKFNEAEKVYTDPPRGLTADNILKRWHQLNIPYDPAHLLDAAARALKCEYTKHLFHYLSYYWQCVDNAVVLGAGCKLPLWQKLKGRTEGMLLDLALALDECNAIEKKFSELQIPEVYAYAAMQHIVEDITVYRKRFDLLGYGEFGHHWLRFFIEGKLFRIGRFEYWLQDEVRNKSARFFRSKSNGSIAALCPDNWLLDQEGLQLFTDIAPEQAFMKSCLYEDEHCYRGTPVNPGGFAEVGKVISLNKNEYVPLWNSDSLVPDIHIPPGGNMSLEVCLSSLLEAREFFIRYFHKTPAAFTSFSWIFNPDFCQVAPQSNISKFMQELYLMPLASGGLDGLEFVFGKASADWADYPEDNSLRRAFHALRRNSRRLKSGGMVIEERGIENFGRKLYLTEYNF